LTIPSFVIYNGITYDVTEIDWVTFINCSDLKSIIIPNSILEIGSRAFYGSGITLLDIPKSVTYIEYAAFASCDSLTTLNFNASYCKFHSYYSHPREVVFFPVFKDCHSLKDIHIGDSVKKIPANFINNCNGLNQISIPNNVDTIGSDAFKNCPNLVHASLGSGIKHIDKDAFSTNPLGSIICYMEEPPTLNSNGVFSEATQNNAQVIIPCNSLDSYSSAVEWKDFAHLKDPCVDLEEIETTEFNLYPNPVTTELNITCSENIETIEIFNILGQQVYSSRIGTMAVTINVASLKSGNYIAKIYTDNSISTKKFIVK
jgi:hypothetical protein